MLCPFNQLFAMLLEEILRKNGSIFNHRYLLLHFLELKVLYIMQQLMIQRLRKMSEKYILVAMATDFCNLRSF